MSVSVQDDPVVVSGEHWVGSSHLSHNALWELPGLHTCPRGLAPTALLLGLEREYNGEGREPALPVADSGSIPGSPQMSQTAWFGYRGNSWGPCSRRCVHEDGRNEITDSDSQKYFVIL